MLRALKRRQRVTENIYGMLRVINQLIKVEGDEIAFCSAELFLAAASWAETLAGTVGAAPVRIIFYCVKVGVVEVLEAETTELPCTWNV